MGGGEFERLFIIIFLLSNPMDFSSRTILLSFAVVFPKLAAGVERYENFFDSAPWGYC